MLYEDLRSHCMQRHEYTLQLLKEIDSLKEELDVQKEENNALDEQISKLER